MRQLTLRWRRRFLPVALPSLLAGVAMLLGACSESRETSSELPASKAPASRAPGPSTDASQVLATIGGEPLTHGDVAQRAADELAKIELEYQKKNAEIIEGTLKNMVREHVLEREGAAQGKSTEAMLTSALESEAQVTDAEVDTWYEVNKERLGGRTKELVRPQIRQFLQRQKRDSAQEKMMKDLEEKHEVVYLLEPFRVDLDNTRSPSLGPESASVTLVEFSDFECPFCSRFTATLEDLKKTYGDRIRVVFRQFPLSIHANAQKAAEASLCAQDQDRFWDMHDLLFAEQHQLEPEHLKEKAGRLGLDATEFARCLDSGKHEQRVQDDLTAGMGVGVNGTPALFVNGRPVPGGAAPYEAVAAFIEEELARNRRH